MEKMRSITGAFQKSKEYRIHYHGISTVEL